MVCNGICIRYKATRIHQRSWYENGHKRCQICVIYIKWDGLYCPCCMYRLRCKPRNRIYKAKLRGEKYDI